MSERWRYTCPHGHVNVKRRGREANSHGRFYCGSCQEAGRDPHYSTLVDQKTGQEVAAR
jgi:hypothetical protein